MGTKGISVGDVLSGIMTQDGAMSTASGYAEMQAALVGAGVGAMVTVVFVCGKQTALRVSVVPTPKAALLAQWHNPHVCHAIDNMPTELSTTDVSEADLIIVTAGKAQRPKEEPADPSAVLQRMQVLQTKGASSLSGVYAPLFSLAP